MQLRKKRKREASRDEGRRLNWGQLNANLKVGVGWCIWTSEWEIGGSDCQVLTAAKRTERTDGRSVGRRLMERRPPRLNSLYICQSLILESVSFCLPMPEEKEKKKKEATSVSSACLFPPFTYFWFIWALPAFKKEWRVLTAERQLASWNERQNKLISFLNLNVNCTIVRHL